MVKIEDGGISSEEGHMAHMETYSSNHHLVADPKTNPRDEFKVWREPRLIVTCQVVSQES